MGEIATWSAVKTKVGLGKTFPTLHVSHKLSVWNMIQPTTC